MALTPRVLVARPSLVIAGGGAVVFGVWTGRPSEVADVRACLPMLLDFARKANPAALVVAVHQAASAPSKEVRDAIQVEMAKVDPYLLCGATVISREGFAGSAMRAVTSTLQLLSRPKHPEKIFATAREAAVFVSGELLRAGVKDVSASDVQDAYDRLMKEHGLPLEA